MDSCDAEHVLAFLSVIPVGGASSCLFTPSFLSVRFTFPLEIRKMIYKYITLYLIIFICKDFAWAVMHLLTFSWALLKKRRSEHRLWSDASSAALPTAFAVSGVGVSPPRREGPVRSPPNLRAFRSPS